MGAPDGDRPDMSDPPTVRGPQVVGQPASGYISMGNNRPFGVDGPAGGTLTVDM